MTDRCLCRLCKAQFPGPKRSFPVPTRSPSRVRPGELGCQRRSPRWSRPGCHEYIPAGQTSAAKFSYEPYWRTAMSCWREDRMAERMVATLPARNCTTLARDYSPYREPEHSAHTSHGASAQHRRSFDRCWQSFRLDRKCGAVQPDEREFQQYSESQHPAPGTRVRVAYQRTGVSRGRI